jgi:diketogulonate reductase-like aldo/keto reductase
MQSISLLDFGGYFDLFLVHWPVPGCFIDTYKELELLHGEGYLKNLGVSNFSPEEYELLMAEQNNITIPPVVNQFEVSPFMYRPGLVSFFQEKGVLVSSSKALHRGDGFDDSIIQQLSEKYRDRVKGCLRIRATPAQIIIRWGVQKGLIVVTKTATSTRMVENRDVLQFSLSEDEMTLLDGLTTADDIEKREQLEVQRKSEL